MILGFKPQFLEPILNGTKIHTIRIDKHDRWKADREIHLATGVRSKNYNCFKKLICLSTQSISMTALENNSLELYIDGKAIYILKADELARNDGFENIIEFEKWFYPIVDSMPYKNLDFKIIHWTKFKY